MKGLGAFLTALGLCLVPSHMFSAAGTGPGSGLLDLPDGFGQSLDEEDEPELIEFYDNEYEGDAFLFVLDRSSSMGQTSSTGEVKFLVLKREVTKALSGLTRRSVVSCVFYDGNAPLVYGDPPVRMDLPGKTRMIAQVNGTPISAGSCMVKGTDRGLDIAGRTQNEHRTMILVADGRTHCSSDENDPDRVFQRIMSRNVLRIPINTIYTGPLSGEDWNVGKPLLERIARATGGTFRIAR